MKQIVLGGLVSLLVLSGFALAHQPGEKRDSGRGSMMQHGMMGEKGTEDMQGMGHMDGMMRMMKMMDQCASMMESHGSEEPKDNPEK